MKNTSMTAAMGFVTFFASCPVAYTALYPFGSCSLEPFFVATMIGLAVATATILGRGGVGWSQNGNVWRLGFLCVTYVCGIAAFDVLCGGTGGVLLAIASGMLIGSASAFFLLSWACMLCSGKFAENMVLVGCLCGCGAALSWLLQSTSGSVLIVLHAALSLASVILFFRSARRPRNMERGLNGHPDRMLDRDPSRSAFSKMLSIAFVPLVGLVIATSFSSASLFHAFDRLVVFGMDGEMAGFVLAAFVIALVGTIRPRVSLLVLFYRLAIPVCIVIVLLLIAVRQDDTSYQITSLLVMVLIPFLALLAIVVSCTLCGTGEFDPRLAVGPVAIVYASTHLASLPLNKAAIAWGGAAHETIMAVCLAFLLVYQIVQTWRDLIAPDRDIVPAESGRGLQDVCERMSVENGLTARETELFAYMARGYSPAYIAGLFTLSESTVRTHIKSIYRKIGVSSREELLNLVNGMPNSDKLESRA